MQLDMKPDFPSPIVSHVPILILCPVERCNCRCLMCGYWSREATSMLTLEQVESIAEEAYDFGVQHAVFSGGEPLLHPDINSMCLVFKQYGTYVTVLTNGLLLEKWAEPLSAVCDEIIISLDGPSEIHDEIRRISGGYERIAKGIQALRNHTNTLRISGRCTVQKRNIRHLCRTVDAAHELGLEKISFLAVSDDRSQFWQKAQPGEPEDIIPNIADISALENELDLLAKDYADDYKSSFIAESPEKHKHRLHQYFLGLHGLGEFFPTHCNAPWFSAIIESNGDVRTCFFTDVVGNVFNGGGLKNVINSEKAQNLRTSIEGKAIRQCVKCVSTLNYKESHPQ